MANERKVITVPVEGTPERRDFGDSCYVTYGYTGLIYPETSLDSLIQTLTELRSQYVEYYDNLRIASKRDCGCYSDCNCSPTLFLVGDRLENDLEYEVRLKLDRRRNERQEQEERRQYDILKAKFEKVSRIEEFSNEPDDGHEHIFDIQEGYGYTSCSLCGTISGGDR